MPSITRVYGSRTALARIREWERPLGALLIPVCAVGGVDDEYQEPDDQDDAEDRDLRFRAAGIGGERGGFAERVHADPLHGAEDAAFDLLLRPGPAPAISREADEPGPEALRPAHEAHGGDDEEKTGGGPEADIEPRFLIGAGDGGRLVLREIVRNRELKLSPAGFVDDDPTKRGTRIDGVKVLGDTNADLPRVMDEVEPDDILIAIPSAAGTLRARVVRAARERGIPVRTLPTVFELLQGGQKYVRQVRLVQVEDVLGREPVRMDLDRVGAYLTGETVLVTGAGGSIGSELCRQIARVAPRRIVLLDHAEDNLFAIQRELEDDRHVHPSTLAAVLADAKEGERMREVFTEFRPTVVFHAAAYKHVGLMEANPVEAVRNNALATRLMARIAGETGVRRFVHVSTDKAVTPQTVMGASKALAEFAVEEAAQRWPGTEYTAVRFGNVLGSSGSVVPIFRRQIERGGPVTITDERMTRYFMTIPEAVQLIIRSGSLGGRGEIFVLEMGEPVSIMQLARDMIELSGLDPDRDIAIEVVGRRPGEKLHEELFNPYEHPQPTPAERILHAERTPRDPEEVSSMFESIALLALEGDVGGLAEHVGALSATRVTPRSPDSP